MTAIAAISSPPSPLELETKFQQYRDLDQEIRDTTLESKLALAEKLKGKEGEKSKPEQLDLLWEEIVALVDKHGGAHEKKSKLLPGVTLEAVATFGQSSTIDANAVERFRLALVKEKNGKLLKKLFEKTVRWTLKSAASVIVKSEKLPKGLSSLYSQCYDLKDNTPRLVVREKNG